MGVISDFEKIGYGFSPHVTSFSKLSIIITRLSAQKSSSLLTKSTELTAGEFENPPALFGIAGIPRRRFF